jgi:NADPH:quinone reductase-like Zn-dependent oxidoreductase
LHDISGSRKMRALQFERFGNFNDVLRVVEVGLPMLRAGEVLVKVAATSVNPSDAKNILGRMQGTTLPRIPGRDFAGVVVDGPAKMIGTEIWGSGGDIGFTRDGAHAEYLIIPQESVTAKPAHLSMVEAAAVGTNYITAYLGLIETANVQANEWVMVTGATGGVGSSVIQLAKWKQARVIAVVRTKPNDDFIQRYGIDLVIDSGTEDIVARVREATDGAGVNLTFDCVGGSLFEKCLNSLGQLGRQINITSVDYRRVTFDLPDFYHRQLTLHGVDSRSLDTAKCAHILSLLTSAFDSGVLRPPQIAITSKLANAVDAYQKVDNGSAHGKVVLSIENG